jgi:hypothetical protein
MAEVVGVADGAVPVNQKRMGASAALVVDRPHSILDGLRGIVEQRHALQQVPETLESLP